MSQKTITISGKTYTPSAVDRLMQESDYHTANGYSCHIYLNGVGYYAAYRERGDDYYAPVCSRAHAGYIQLRRGYRGYLPDEEKEIWLEFCPK